MTDDAGWDGTERRTTDQRLAAAIVEVRDLRMAAAKLATAVEVRTDEFRRVVQRVGVMLAILFLALTAFSLWQVSRLSNHLGAGQHTITCLLLVDPTARAAETLIDCQRR